MSPEIREHIRRIAVDMEDNPARGPALWRSAVAVLKWLDAADADSPPNTERVRVLMDVSPPYEQDGSSRIVYVTKIDEFIAELQIARTKLEPGWRRSIGVLDAPVPEPIAVVRGTVETP